MILRQSVSDCVPELIDRLGSSDYASLILEKVISQMPGVDNVVLRPAEYCVERPVELVTPTDGEPGVHVVLDGVSRGTRAVSCFHRAIETLAAIVASEVRHGLENADSRGRVQVFCSIRLDRDIETSPGSGEYAFLLEAKPVWVTADGIEREEPAEGTTETHG